MTSTIQLLQSHPFLLGLALRLSLLFLLPLLLDDNPLLRGVRYTDIDYDVFTDAAFHVADGRSPYERHTYRYTPFLASLLAWPLDSSGHGDGDARTSLNNHGEEDVPLLAWRLIGTLLSAKYFGKILFCVADAICGYIIVVLRKQRRRRISEDDDDERQYKQNNNNNPESLVVLLPVLATVAIADMYNEQVQSSSSFLLKQSSWRLRRWGTTIPIIARACLAGIMHGVGIHAKLYPVIYTISFMAYFSHWQQQQQQQQRVQTITDDAVKRTTNVSKAGWTHVLSKQMEYLGDCFCCGPSNDEGISTFPWRHPLQIFMLGLLWVQRLFLTLSSILFLVFTVGTVGALTHAAVHFHGREALEEGLLYHFQRVDHRHNYSMYWYWIYLARGRSYANANELSAVASPSSSIWGHLPLIPQVLILGFSSLGIAPYDLTFALFCQTFAFVAFNKVMTAQYFTWYLCLLPLCSDRIKWNSRRMAFSLGLLAISIIAWLLSAFSLEMLGWRSHRQVWLASLFFFVANVNLLTSILDGYKHEQIARAKTRPGEGWSKPKAKVT
eukprot:g8443.t1 g8443   contig3:112842-114695(-)